jgi:hypothetical protein
MGVERKDSANNLGYPNTVYGPVDSGALASKGSATGTGHGQVNEYKAEYEFDFADLPSSFTSETDKSLTTIPSGAVLKSADILVTSAISGGTDFIVGVSQPDGSVIDADGILAANVTTASGTYIAGDGNDLGVALATDAQVTVGGTRTAGKFKLYLTYLVL